MRYLSSPFEKDDLFIFRDKYFKSELAVSLAIFFFLLLLALYGCSSTSWSFDSIFISIIGLSLFAWLALG